MATMTNEREAIFGIDQDGEVWILKQRGSTIQQPAKWSLLPNPDQIIFKRFPANRNRRLSSTQNLAWGISADHHVYCYMLKPDIPIRIREEIYENQRWNPIGGFCDNLLPTDRFPFSNKEGTENRAKSLVIPSQSWVWKDDWQIENTYGSEVLDADGWTYAVDFPASYSAHKDWKSCVRRRKWFRIREYVGYDFWNLVEGVQEIAGGDTNDPLGFSTFTDVSVSTFGLSHEDLSCVWAVTLNGQVYFRRGVTQNQPEGIAWKHIPLPDTGMDAAQVSVSANGWPFIVTWTGGVLYRTGVTLNILEGTKWMIANGPPGGTFQLSVGKNSMWAVTRDRKCWSLKDPLTSVYNRGENDPVEWVEIPGRMKTVTVSKTDMIVFAIGNDDNVAYYRYGIVPDQLHGQVWKPAFSDINWETMSISTARSESEDSSDEFDGISNSGYESDALSSVRPEIPHGRNVIDVDSFTSPVVAGRNLCWVDGGCASSLRTVNEPDLEVGPWREEILTGLQFKKIERNKFQFPNAIDNSAGWSKSTKARILQHRKHETWTKGELELTNNETLVFYKDLHHSWMCATSDVLSVLLSCDFSAAFMMRIRNPVDPGTSDYVTLKFENETDMEEWRKLLIDASFKSRESWSLGNAWLVSNAGEVHEGGLVKIAESPVNAEISLALASSEVKVHHPLIKGFMPGSSLSLELSIPSDSARFALNFNGRDCTVFHFNPRMTNQIVVRNSKSSKGEWGDEERDGVFPFQPGQTYSMLFHCSEKEFVVSITGPGKTKHKFNFYYQHRFGPKLITHFVAVGDVNISSVRYEPGRLSDGRNIEFISTPVPGHFWKVESVVNGVTWAIGTDLNVWAYIGGTKYGQRSEFDNLVTAEQVYYIYENQRWNPLSGFSSVLLPTDRSPWSDETGVLPRDKNEIKLPSCKWAWVSDWEIDDETEGGVDAEGWQYSIDFPATYHGSKRFSDLVRRRRWKRVGNHTETGPWSLISGVKLVDLCVRMNDNCDYEVVGVCQNGDAVVRNGITQETPCGTSWESIPSQKPFVSISGFYKQRTWAIGKDGFAYIIYQDHWQLLDRPHSSRLKQIRVGPAGIWAVGTNNYLYRRTEVQPLFPEGKEWSKVCDGVQQISLGSEGSVWALVTKGDRFQCSIAKRKAVSETNPAGVGWEMVAEGPWRYFSITGSFQRNL